MSGSRNSKMSRTQILKELTVEWGSRQKYVQRQKYLQEKNHREVWRGVDITAPMSNNFGIPSFGGKGSDNLGVPRLGLCWSCASVKSLCCKFQG